SIETTFNSEQQSLGVGAFQNCVSLRSIDLPDSLTAIGPRAFANTGFEKFILPKNVTALGTKYTSRGYSYYFGAVFRGCKSLQEFVFNDKVTEIYPDMFAGCTGIKSITIPRTITRIRDDAFLGCSSLSSITFNGNLDGGDFLGRPYTMFLGDSTKYYQKADDGEYVYTTGMITRLVIGPGVTKLNVQLRLPPMPLAEQVKLRELGIRSTHGGDAVPYRIEYR
ncbi:MAG: leucine-rich repeat domain-containing protein, partial [Treponema sp.]|nr:leucine-rich repeat domain-containing protein [Treponema sp.]